MEREDQLRTGIDERLLHLVISDGSTVSEHVQTLDRNQQAEFAELRTAGRFVIRPSDEIETRPRDITEARQSTPEFAFVARRSSDRDFVFQDASQAREFVDLVGRLVGEDPDGETRRVWAREMYSRFLYERDPAAQQHKLEETMQYMRDMAAEIAPLDPGRNALAYAARAYHEDYKVLVKDFGPDPGRRALEYVRDLASSRSGIENRSEALAAMRKREPDKWGDVKGRTQRERELRALDFLRREDADAYASITRYDPRELQHHVLEFLKNEHPDAYDKCHRYTAEHLDRELQLESQATTYFDPERLSTGPIRSDESDRPQFSLADQRAAGSSYEQARLAYDAKSALEQGMTLEPSAYGNILASFDLGDNAPGKAALALVRQQALTDLSKLNPELHDQLVDRHGDDAPARALKVMQREAPDTYGMFKGASEAERETLALDFTRVSLPEDYQRIHHEALAIAVGHTFSEEPQQGVALVPYADQSSSYGVTQYESTLSADPVVSLGELDPLERDDHEFAFEQEQSFHELSENDPGISVHEGGRMGADYIVVGEIYGVPPAPEALLERYPELRAAFENFEERISGRIWDGDSIGQIYAGFHDFMDNLRVREMSDEARAQIRSFNENLSQTRDESRDRSAQSRNNVAPTAQPNVGATQDRGQLEKSALSQELDSVRLDISNARSRGKETEDKGRRDQLASALRDLRATEKSLGQRLREQLSPTAIGRGLLEMVENDRTVQGYGRIVMSVVDFVERRLDRTDERVQELRQRLHDCDPSDKGSRADILRELLPLRLNQLEKERDQLLGTKVKNADHAERVNTRLAQVESNIGRNLAAQERLSSNDERAGQERPDQTRQQQDHRPAEPQSKDASANRAAPAQDSRADAEYHSLSARIEITSIFAARVESMLEATRAQSARLSSRALTLQATNLARDGQREQAQELFHQAVGFATASGNRAAQHRAQHSLRSELGDQQNNPPTQEVSAAERSTRAAENKMRADTAARMLDDVKRLDERSRMLEARHGQLVHEHAELTGERSHLTPPQSRETPKAPIYIEDGRGSRVAVRDEHVWNFYADHLSDYQQTRTDAVRGLPDNLRAPLAESAPSDPAVFSTAAQRNISDQQVRYNPVTERYDNRDDLVQLETHFNRRMAELTRRDHPELARMSSDWRFREAALVMRAGYDERTGRDARDVLANLHAASRATRGREGGARGFSRNDLRMLETVLYQNHAYQVEDATRHIADPAVRDQARAQLRRDQEVNQAKHLSHEQSVEVRLKADLVTRAERHGHTGIDLFIALTKNETMRNGTRSALYEPFNELPDSRRAEIYQFARDLREQVDLRNMNAERGSINESSPTLRAYIETYRVVTQDNTLTRDASLKETWSRLEERIGQLKTYPAEDRKDVFKVINDTKGQHERLERLSGYRNQLWESADREARAALVKNVWVAAEARVAEERKGVGRATEPSDRKEVEGRVNSIWDAARREADAIQKSKTIPGAEPQGRTTQQNGNGRAQQQQLNQQSNVERRIYSLVSPETRKALNSVERSITTARLDIARNFVQLDRATRLVERPREQGAPDRGQQIREELARARTQLERQSRERTLGRPQPGREPAGRQDPGSPTRTPAADRNQSPRPAERADAARQRQSRSSRGGR